MALLGFANIKFIGGIQSNSQQPITTTLKATDLKTGKTQTIDLKVADKEIILSTTVDQSNDGRIFFVTSQDVYSLGQTRWTFSIKAIDLYTGELLTVLESSQNYSQNQEPINPYQQIGTDLLGNLYVLNKTTSGTALKVVASDTKNKAILSGNELTKQLNSFYASDAKVVNGVTLQDKPKQYTLSSFYASPDGSFYVLGKNSSYKQDRLFQVLLSTETSSADTQPDGKPIPKYSFTPVTSGLYKVENVVALNNANALVQIGNDWKAYQSSTGTPNTYIDNLLSLDYNSPFQLKTVKTSKQFIPSGINISGNYGLDISYFDPDGRQQISNLTSLLPMQPGAARSQIAGTQNKAMQVGDLTASLVEIGGSNPVLQLGALSQHNMIVDQQEIDVTGDAWKSHLILSEDGTIHVVTFSSLLADGRQGQGYRDLIIQDDRFKVVGQDGLYGLIKIDSTQAKPQSFSADAAYQSLSSNTIVSALMTEGTTLESTTAFDGISEYQVSTNDYGPILITAKSSALPISESILSADIALFPSSSQSYSVSSLTANMATNEFNTSFEWGVLPGFIVPIKSSYWEDKQGSEPARKEKFVKWKDDKEGKFSDGSWEIEVKGGPKSFSKAKDLKNTSAAWKWSTTYATELSGKLKMKIGQPKMVDPVTGGGGTISAYDLRKKQASAKAKQNAILKDQQNSFTEVFNKTRERIMTQNDLKPAEVDTIINAAKMRLQETNRLAAEALKDTLVKAEQKSLDLGLSVAGAWKYEGDYVGIAEKLRQFKLDFGATVGIKIPIRNLGSIASLYFILGAQIGFRWTQDYKSGEEGYNSVNSQVDLDEILAAGLSMPDLIELVDTNGLSINKLSLVQQNALKPNDVRWRFRFSPTSLFPQSALTILQTTAKISQAAAEVMLYIPPTLFFTLASKLGGNDNKRVDANDMNAPSPKAASKPITTNYQTTILMSDMVGSSSSMQLYQRPNSDPTGSQLMEEASVALRNIMDVQVAATALDTETLNTFSGFLKLKEFGLQTVFSIPAFDIDLKGFVGYDLSLGSQNGVFQGKFSAGIGAQATLKAFFFSIPFNFYFTFFSSDFSDPTASFSNGFYGNQTVSTAYQNLMAAENFSPIISVINAPPPLALPLLKGTSGETFNPETKIISKYKLNSGRFPSLDSKIKNTVAVYVEPVQAGTSKTGLIVDAFLISGYTGSSGTTTWDTKSIKKVSRGLLSDIKIQGVNYNQKQQPYLPIETYLPVITFNGISESSTAAYQQALATTTQISGTVNMLSIAANKASIIGTWTTLEPNSASRFSQSISIVAGPNRQENYIASSMPSAEYNQGAVLLRSVNLPSQGGSALNLIYSSDPADQVAFGLSTDASESPNGDVATLTIALDGGSRKSIPVAYTILNPWQVINQGTIELASTSLASVKKVMSGLVTADRAPMRVRQVASLGYQIELGSTGRQWQAVSYIGSSLQLQTSVVQLSNINHTASSQLNYFFTQSSIDTALSTNDYFSGSIARYGAANSTANYLAVGATGSAYILDLSTVSPIVNPNENSSSPFIRLKGVDTAPIATFKVAFIYAGVELDLWLDFDTAQTGSDYNQLTKDQLVNAVLQSRTDTSALFGYNYVSRLIATNAISMIAIGDASMSLVIDGSELFGEKAGVNLELNDINYALASDSPQSQVNSFVIRSFTNNQPLSVKSIASFDAKLEDDEKVKPASPIGDWLCVSTDDSDGNSLLYLITDTARINQSLMAEAPTTLWLDKYSGLRPDEFSFDQGTTGIAFLHGSTLDTYISQDGTRYLVIGDAATMVPGKGLDNTGRVFIMKYDDKLIQYARTNSGPSKVPFIDPVKYLGLNPTQGAILNGDQANGLYGQQIAIYKDSSGHDVIAASQPGTLNAEALSNLQQNQSNTNLFYTPYDGNDYTTVGLTTPGTVAKDTYVYQNGDNFVESQLKRSLIFTTETNSINTNNVQNQNLYAFGLQNLKPEVTSIAKNFNGVITSISSSIAKNSQAGDSKQLDALVTDSSTGSNYIMTTKLTDRSFKSTNGQFDPLAVDWSRQLASSTQSAGISERPIALQLNETKLISTLDLSTPAVMEGESLIVSMSNLTGSEIRMNIRLEDISAYENKDYEPLELNLNLASGASQNQITIKTIDNDEYRPARMFRVVAESYDLAGNKLGQSHVREVRINTNKVLDLATIGTGAALSTSVNSALALSACSLPASQSKDHFASILSAKIDPSSGLLVSPFLTILKHADKDYNLSKNTDYNKNYNLPTWLNPAAIQHLSFGNLQYLAVSGTNTQFPVPQQQSRVLFYDTTGDTQALLSKPDNFFESPAFQIISTSPSFGTTIGGLKFEQDTYTVITDPAASCLYLIDNKTIGSLANIKEPIDIDKLVMEKTKRAFKITATKGGQGIAFGASYATGDLHGNQVLAIGAPMANEGADASTAIYGGRVYLLNLLDIVSATSHVIDISETSQSSVRSIQIEGLTAVDKDPTSSTYLQGYGPALGASLAFANIVDLKDKGKSQLLIGAPQYTAGSEETGAIFVLDPTSTALQFEAVKTKTIPFNSLYFATGLQDQSLTGMTFIGDSGDMIGTSIINLKQFTGGKDGADSTDKDVISIAAPARFDGAGGVYVYIGNNNKHLALEQLNPSSIYQHSFQYVGTVAGADLANGIGPLIQAGVNTNSIGQFSKPLSADYPQGNDLVVSVNNSITPGAIMVYGKPYLYPGNTTSIFDVSAGGFAKPIVGSGLPVPIGDANLDGFGDYVLYQQSLNGRNQDSRPVQSTLVYGNGPTVLTAYPEAKFSTAIASTWQLQENLAFGPIRQAANITAQPISATSLQHTSALFAGGSKLNAIARSAYLGYQSSPISDTNYAYGSGALATGRFLQSDPYREVMVQYRYNGNPVDKPLIDISITRLDSATSSNVNIPFDASKQRLTSLTTTTNLTQKQGGESSFLLGIVRRSTDGIAEFAIQRFSLLSEKQASMPEDIFKASSSSFKYDDNARFLITSQFIFNGSTYATIAKTSSPANNQGRYCELSIVNLSTGHEQAIATIATPAGANSELIAWFDNLSPAALISALDDWNGDGLPDISFTGLSSTRVSGQNPFINTVLFGGLANSSTASVWQRYSLFWSNQDSQSIRPLALQAPIQLLSLGDTTGSGSASLLAAPLPSNGLNEKVSSQFSFELFPSEYSGANTQKINGSEGSDYIVIDGSVPYGKLEKGLVVIDLEQGDDNLQILKQAVTSPLSLRPLVYVSGGSGNDTVSVDGYLLQGDFSPSGKGAPIDLVYNGGSGFNALKVLAGGNLSAPIDITRLLNNAVGLSEIVSQQDLFVDCSRLYLPQGRNFENANGIFITAPYGTTIALINAQTFVPGDMTVRNGLNYVQYSDYVSGYSFFVQQGITLNMPGVVLPKLTVLPYSPSSGVAPFNTTFRTPSGDLQGDVVLKRLDAAPQVNIQNKNLDIGQTGIDFSLNLDPDKPGDTARAIVELDPLLDGLELTSGGVKKRLAYFAYGTSFGEDAPVATPFTYDPVQKAGARFYDLDGNGSADIADLQFVDGGYGDKDGLKNGVVVDPSTAGTVNLTAIFTSSANTLTVSDPTDTSSPASLVVRASLSSRSSTVNQIGYVALNASESLSLSYDLVKERGTLLFGTLQNNDVPDTTKMSFQRDINLINGQKLMFFEVVDNTLEAMLKSGRLDSSFRTLDVTKLTDSSATAGKGGSILSLFLSNDVSGLGELISSQMGDAPVFDFSSLSDQALTGDVLIAREASYDSTIGFYKLERSDGAVRDTLTNTLIMPGEVGYTAAALRSDNLFTGFGSLATGNRINKTATLDVFKDAGLLAPFARVANTGETYFSFAAANSDGLSHFRVLGSGVLGLEDIKGGGDRDFDDLIVAFNFRLSTGTLA
jgi:hypothetical protein